MNIIDENYTNALTLVSMCIDAHSLGIRYFKLYEVKIKKNTLDENEQKRAKEALKVYNETTDIWVNIKLIDFPEYTMASLRLFIAEICSSVKS